MVYQKEKSPMNNEYFDRLYNNKYFRASRPFQTNQARINEITEKVFFYNPQTILDVGCGLGVLVRHWRGLGKEAVGIDRAHILKESWWKPEETYFVPGKATKLPFGDKSFDVVFSSDFFEHLPEDEIETVVNEMTRVGKTVLARIAFKADITTKQARYHVTNQTKEWWEKKLGPRVIII